MATNVGIIQSMLQIEALRDQVKSIFADPSSSSLEQRMSFLMQIEMRAFGAFQDGPPEEHLNPEEFQAEVRQDVERFRNRIFPILPAVTPEHRTNAMTHTTPKSLPAAYFELILDAVEEPDRAEMKLKKAAEMVPACHIAWRLLALVTIEKLPSRKSKKVERIADNLKPLSYFVKVVQLLPKDFRVWWHIAKHLYRTEVDYAGCPKLRSLIHVTVNNKKYSSWDCFARVLELEPNVPVFWFYLGQSMLRSHHLFVKDEIMVDINFVSGPKMSEVTARYCYEAYIGISPPNSYLPWFHVANAMLNERDVMVDVDDAFTSIEVNGGMTFTRPEVLVKMISVEPHNTDMWIFLHRTLATEPESYRLPLDGLVVPGMDKSTDSLSALDCLARALEIEPRSGGSWLAMYDFLHHRDTLQADLHKVCPHPDDNNGVVKKFSSCVVSGKTYTKFDCVLMVHMLYVASAPPGCVSGEKEVFDLWLIIASWACDSPSGKITLPQGKEVLPLKDVNNISYKTKTSQITFPDAFLKSFEESRRWGCEVRLRLLHLFRDKGEELGRRWPEAVYLMYDLLPKKKNICGLDCANCCLLVATCLKLSNTAKVNAHYAHVTAKLNACASLDPETWEELGRMMCPDKKIKIFTNDETSEEYTRADCFKLAIESPKRWNRAGAWLALGNALKKGEVIDIYGKPHTAEDCFKQAWLWFDERPNDQLMSQLSRKAPVPHPIHGTGESDDDESTEEEDEDTTDCEESDESDSEIAPEAAISEVTEESSEKKGVVVKAETEAPTVETTDETAPQHPYPLVAAAAAQQTSSTQQANADLASMKEASPEEPVATNTLPSSTDVAIEETSTTVDPPITYSTSTTAQPTSSPLAAEMQVQEEPMAPSPETVVDVSDNVVDKEDSTAPVVAAITDAQPPPTEEEPMPTSQPTPNNDVATREADNDVGEEEKVVVATPQSHVDPVAETINHTSTTPASSSSSTPPIMDATTTRNTWATLRAVQGGLTALKALTEGGGINQ